MEFSWAESPALGLGDSSNEGKEDPTSAPLQTTASDLTSMAALESLYGSNEFQLLESLFNGNINEFDYITDLPVVAHPGGTTATVDDESNHLDEQVSMLLNDGASTELPAVLHGCITTDDSSEADTDVEGVSPSSMIDVLSAYVKHEPTSPHSFLSLSSTSGSPSPSSPGESSGPSSPESGSFSFGPSMPVEGTINPASLMVKPVCLSPAVTSAVQLVEVKKAPGHKRGRGPSSDDDLASSPSTPLPANCSPDEERKIKRQRRFVDLSQPFPFSIG